MRSRRRHLIERILLRNVRDPGLAVEQGAVSEGESAATTRPAGISTTGRPFSSRSTPRLRPTGADVDLGDTPGALDRGAGRAGHSSHPGAVADAA